MILLCPALLSYTEVQEVVDGTGVHTIQMGFEEGALEYGCPQKNCPKTLQDCPHPPISVNNTQQPWQLQKDGVCRPVTT